MLPSCCLTTSTSGLQHPPLQSGGAGCIGSVAAVTRLKLQVSIQASHEHRRLRFGSAGSTPDQQCRPECALRHLCCLPVRLLLLTALTGINQLQTHEAPLHGAEPRSASNIGNTALLQSDHLLVKQVPYLSSGHVMAV